jgi:putative proteasome-type protease
MNSTIRSNLTVGPPVDLLIYEKDSLNFTHQLCLTEDDPFAKEIGDAWNEGVIQALQHLPKFDWEISDENFASPVANSDQSSY